MRLPRTRRMALLSAVLLVAAMAGHASADLIKQPKARPLAAAQPKHGKPAARAKPKSTSRHVRRLFSGPAGSRTTTGSAAVALTFDDGPDPAVTPRLLRLLAAQHVHATFCLIGRNVQRHPELVRQIVAGGNTLCNHTWNHSLRIGTLPSAQIRADLLRTSAAITRAAPGARVKYFRAPGGKFTSRLVAVAAQAGMSSIYWRVDPRDWDHPTGESDQVHQARVIARIERDTQPGSIVLSHDGGQPDTVAAYRTVLPWLRHRYRLIALP